MLGLVHKYFLWGNFFFCRELKKFKRKEMMEQEMTDTGVCEVINYSNHHCLLLGFQ